MFTKKVKPLETRNVDISFYCLFNHSLFFYFNAHIPPGFKFLIICYAEDTSQINVINMMRIYEVTKILNFTFIYFEINLKCMLKIGGICAWVR